MSTKMCIASIYIIAKRLKHHMFISSRMDNVFFPVQGNIIFSENEQAVTLCNPVNESHKHNV